MTRTFTLPSGHKVRTRSTCRYCLMYDGQDAGLMIRRSDKLGYIAQALRRERGHRSRYWVGEIRTGKLIAASADPIRMSHDLANTPVPGSNAAARQHLAERQAARPGHITVAEAFATSRTTAAINAAMRPALRDLRNRGRI